MRFNGKDFADFGVFVDESKAFGSPEKDYELVEIMGRNGNLSIYNDRFKDITLPFPCFIRTGFIEKYRSLLAYLNSQAGYQRLETDKEPNHFRKALFQGIVDPQTTAFNHGGFFTVNLLAHPQRFLKSGEIPVSASSQSNTYTGNPVSINNPSGISAVSSLAVALNPIQNLNGYDSPWVGGSGKNKLPSHAVGSTTISGVTFTVNEDGTVTVNGTATANASFTLSNITINGGILNGCPSSGGWDKYVLAIDGGATDTGSSATVGNISNKSVYIFIRSGYTANNLVFKPMVRETGTSAEYEPYSNICPIYASNGKNLLPPSTTQTSNGVKFTVNDDGTITAARTASSTNNAEYDLTVPSSLYGKTVILNGCPSGGSDSGTYRMFFLVNGSRQATDYGNGVTYTIPSSPTSCVVRINVFKDFNSTATFKPMIRPASITDSTYVPYQSIVVTRTGKNLINVADKTMQSEGYVFNQNLNLPTGQYVLSYASTTPTNRGAVAATGHDGNNCSTSLSTQGNKIVCVINAPYGIASMRVYNGAASYSEIQLELGSTATEYEPYQANTYYIDLGDERYGGTVDLATGVLTVTHGFVTFDGSTDENWTLQTDGRRCAIRLTNCKNVDGIRRTIGAISNLFEEKYPIDTWNSVIGFSIEANGDLVVRQFTTNTMTTDSFKAFLQSNPMQICYPLQTPQTVQLTAQQISLLTGTNYISSSDEVTVTVSEPSLLENPTLFESKPLIRVYGHGTLIVNNQYVTIAENPYAYIDIDCDMMDCYYGSNNANQYVSFSTNDYITLKSGNNYIAYDGTVQITPRWYEV